MSASDAIVVIDAFEDVKRKINKHAFLVVKRRKKSTGALAVITRSISPFSRPISSFFFLEDDTTLEKIRQDYTSGEMLKCELKKAEGID